MYENEDYFNNNYFDEETYIPDQYSDLEIGLNYEQKKKLSALIKNYDKLKEAKEDLDVAEERLSRFRRIYFLLSYFLCCAITTIFSGPVKNLKDFFLAIPLIAFGGAFFGAIASFAIMEVPTRTMKSKAYPYFFIAIPVLMAIASVVLSQG